MFKKLPQLIILIVLIFASCSPGRLTRTDLMNLPDKNFSLTEVSVLHESKRAFYIKGLGIEDLTLKRLVLNSLPVDAIVKTISDDLKINIDTSEYKRGILNNVNPFWKLEKKNGNRLKIVYTLKELPAVGGLGAIGLRLSCEVEIAAADGKVQSIIVESPENQKMCFTPEKIADAKKIPVEEIVKVIVAEELKKLPERIARALKSIKK